MLGGLLERRRYLFATPHRKIPMAVCLEGEDISLQPLTVLFQWLCAWKVEISLCNPSPQDSNGCVLERRRYLFATPHRKVSMAVCLKGEDISLQPLTARFQWLCAWKAKISLCNPSLYCSNGCALGRWRYLFATPHRKIPMAVCLEGEDISLQPLTARFQWLCAWKAKISLCNPSPRYSNGCALGSLFSVEHCRPQACISLMVQPIK